MPDGERGVDDAGVDRLAGLRLLAPVGGGEVRRAGGALEVHLDDRVPLGLGHVDEHAVAQDAGVVDEDVEAAEGVDRPAATSCSAPSQSEMSSLLATASPPMAPDLVDDVAGPGRPRGPSPSIDAAEVVDDDLGALLGQHQRVLAADAPPGAGDDADPSFAQSGHRPSPSTGTAAGVVRMRPATARSFVGAIVATLRADASHRLRCR